MGEERGQQPDSRRPLTPVVRGGLTDRVIEQLRQGIADGTWPLDHRLPVEAALAKQLGVGRSTIREAVRVLVHAGMLEVRQGDGTFVRSRREIDAALWRMVTRASVIEAFEIRRGLEVEAARLAALHRSDADATRLRELAERRRTAYHAGSAEHRKADIAFHELLVAASGSVLLAELYQGIVAPLRAAVATQFDDAELAREPGGPEIDDLVRAIEQRDPQAAATAAATYMDGLILVLKFLLQAVVTGR